MRGRGKGGIGGDGITENDSLDVDSGPNDLLNAPVISSATERFGTVTVDYLLESASAATLVPTIDFQVTHPRIG